MRARQLKGQQEIPTRPIVLAEHAGRVSPLSGSTGPRCLTRVRQYGHSSRVAGHPGCPVYGTISMHSPGACPYNGTHCAATRHGTKGGICTRVPIWDKALYSFIANRARPCCTRRPLCSSFSRCPPPFVYKMSRYRWCVFVPHKGTKVASSHSICSTHRQHSRCLATRLNSLHRQHRLSAGRTGS